MRLYFGEKEVTRDLSFFHMAQVDTTLRTFQNANSAKRLRYEASTTQKTNSAFIWILNIVGSLGPRPTKYLASNLARDKVGDTTRRLILGPEVC